MPPQPSTHEGMGANAYPGGTAFRVWAPNADAVYVSLESEQWVTANHPMAREPSNGEYWSLDLPGVNAGDEYQFVIDNKDGKPASKQGENWKPDAYSRDVNDTDAVTNDPEDVSSIVVNPTTDWGGAWAPFGTP